MNARTLHDLEIADALQRAGIPLHEDVLEKMRRDCRGLSVCQSGVIPESVLFDHGLGMGVALRLLIENETPRNIRIAQFRLDIPWLEPEFCWLPDPWKNAPRRWTYAFSHPSSLVFEREVVLNHRTGSRGLLLPGEWVDGILLGMGQAPIPDKYQERQRVNVRLHVFDSRGRDYTATFALLTQRDRRHRSKEQLASAQRGVESSTTSCGQQDGRLRAHSPMDRGQELPVSLLMDGRSDATHASA